MSTPHTESYQSEIIKMYILENLDYFSARDNSTLERNTYISQKDLRLMFITQRRKNNGIV